MSQASPADLQFPPPGRLARSLTGLDDASFGKFSAVVGADDGPPRSGRGVARTSSPLGIQRALTPCGRTPTGTGRMVGEVGTSSNVPSGATLKTFRPFAEAGDVNEPPWVTT